MRIASLGSGSKGNATVIQTDNTCLLVDCGFNLKQCRQRLSHLGLNPADIDAIFVSHEHSDHIGGVYKLAKYYDISVYMTQGTAEGSRFDDFDRVSIIDAETTFLVGDISVQPVVVPHDAREPCQFIFSGNGYSFGILTDVGCITPHIEKQYTACDALLLEFNHDVDMLANGPYPEMLKQRVGGDYGHLNNHQAIDLLNAIDLEKIQHLLIAHISEKNNSIDSVLACLNMHLPLMDHQKIHFIDQKHGLGWRFIGRTN